MDSYVKAKRFVVEDSITKVTSDGEPHEIMTLVAGLSGLLAAIVILGVLVSLVSCRKNRRVQHCHDCPSSTENLQTLTGNIITDSTSRHGSKRASISNIFIRDISVEEDDTSTTQRTRIDSVSVSIISTGNLEGNLNTAFVGSELSLSGSLRKKQKKTQWRDEIEDERSTAQETRIDIERY